MHQNRSCCIVPGKTNTIQLRIVRLTLFKIFAMRAPQQAKFVNRGARSVNCAEQGSNS